MAQNDVKEVDRTTGDVKKARRFDERDWKTIAEYVIEEWTRRKSDEKRRDRERAWKEIDRQIAMEPDVRFKKLPNGQIDVKKMWMAETELPLQALALEVLVRDASRMMFPGSDQWFRAHAQVTDEYLENAQQIKILGVKQPILSTINQDNADKLAESFLADIFGQYDLPGRVRILNAEAFKYGIGVGRGRMETKNVYIHEARGVRKESQRIPVLVPCSIKNLYLEEPKPTFHSSTVLGPAHIAHDTLRYENLMLAANKGSTDPDDDDGGWMPKQLAKVVAGKGGYVDVLEMEGDIVIPRKTVRSVVIPGAIITVALGGPEPGGASSRSVIRFRFRKYPFSSYLMFPYLQESADCAYPESPLMKGRTIQSTATDSVNRYLDAAALKNSPPVGYDQNNVQFALNGGPEIYPTAQWQTTDPVKVYTEIGGDPAALAQASLQFIQLYQQTTGVLPSRVGAQTVSHTTAFAKNAEIERSGVRTTDYVESIGHGPLTRWLGMSYEMGRNELKSSDDVTLWVDAYGGYVVLDKAMLPEKSSFEWYGAGGPQEKQKKRESRVNSLMMAVKVDQLRMSMGMPPRLNLDAAVDEVLREGGWEDVSSITNAAPTSRGPAPAPQLSGPPEGGGGPAVAAIQNLSSGGA